MEQDASDNYQYKILATASACCSAWGIVWKEADRWRRVRLDFSSPSQAACH